jgi:hypothetical protein
MSRPFALAFAQHRMQTTGLIPDHFSGSYGDRGAMTADTPQQVAQEGFGFEPQTML